jgi:hypothetical protein
MFGSISRGVKIDSKGVELMTCLVSLKENWFASRTDFKARNWESLFFLTQGVFV